MNRAALLACAAAAVPLCLLLAAGGDASVALGGEDLGRLLADDRGATLHDLATGGVRVEAPPGTPLLALAAGRAVATAGVGVHLQGERGSAGFAVDYAGAVAPEASDEVASGAAVATVPASGAVEVSAFLDGEELDLGALIEDTLAAGDEAADLPPAAPGSMERPLDGAVVTQGFGCTDFVAEPADPDCPGGHFHSGIDLAAPLGTTVRAALGGRVHVVRTIGGYGLRVELTHAGGLLTLYGHLSGVDVGDGDVVAAGDPIGRVGSTGNSTGPHLHFEVRRAGVPEDPRIDVSLP